MKREEGSVRERRRRKPTKRNGGRCLMMGEKGDILIREGSDLVTDRALRDKYS